MPVPQLDDRLQFPPVHEAAPDGLLAVGGDLRVDRLLVAYAQGIFPWPHDELPLMWFAPDPRMVLLPDELHVSRSLRSRMKRGEFELRFDTDFRGVVEACSAVPRRGQDGTWITPAMVEAYCRLHAQGFAHSAETWCEGELVGGLYGVSLGGAFFGESMFSRCTDASKVAFAGLAQRVGRAGFRFVDCQLHTDHLASMGARLWTRTRYMRALKDALRLPTLRGRWMGVGDGLRVALPMAPVGVGEEAAQHVAAKPAVADGRGPRTASGNEAAASAG